MMSTGVEAPQMVSQDDYARRRERLARIGDL